jgi:hypothetical protein
MDETQGDRTFLANPLQVQQAIWGVDFPASRQELIERARANEAEETVLFALEHLPDRTYALAREVTDAIGGDVPAPGGQGGPPHPGEPQSAQAGPGPLGDATRRGTAAPGAGG